MVEISQRQRRVTHLMFGFLAVFFLRLSAWSLLRLGIRMREVVDIAAWRPEVLRRGMVVWDDQPSRAAARIALKVGSPIR